MIFAPLLKMRDKLTRKRHSLTQDEEKPFLEHLDDLRKTLTKIFLTLILSVIACFVFNSWFFKVIEHPLDAAGLRDPKERNLPAAVADLKTAEQQPAWWRIHGVARGLADLEGKQREVFLNYAAPDAFTRQFAQAMLLYHVAEVLPEQDREVYLKSAAALLPAEDGPKVIENIAQLAKAKTPTSLEKPHDFVETEAFAPAETFMLSMKLSLFAGIIVSFPLLFYFLLEFILPGLTSRERRLMFPALSIGFALFLAGVLFAFFFVIPRALEFFHEYSAELGIKDRWRIGQYISFVTSFTLIFGFAFELPVVVMVLVKLGLLNCTTMRKSRGWAIVIILVASAILTPTGDMLTMSMLGAPMIIMYEACIWLAWLHERKARKREAEEQRLDQARRAAVVGVASVQTGRAGDDGASTESDHSTGDPPAALPYSADHPQDSSSHGDAHPHHPEETSDAVGDYEQYLRDHASLYSPAETHPESIPVEDRDETPSAEAPSADPDKTPVAEDGGDIPAAGDGEKKNDADPPGPV